jgi:hypothetical protein
MKLIKNKFAFGAVVYLLLCSFVFGQKNRNPTPPSINIGRNPTQPSRNFVSNSIPASRNFGMKVFNQYLNYNIKPNMSLSQRQNIYKNGIGVMINSSNIYLKLSQSNPVTIAQKSERVRDLVKLAGYITGHKNFNVDATYQQELKVNGHKVLGAQHPIRGIFITEDGLQGSFQEQLLLATHEFIHAEDCENHFSQLQPGDSIERYESLEKEWSSRNVGLAMVGREFNTEARAIVAVEGVTGPLSKEKLKEIRAWQAQVFKAGVDFNQNNFYKDKLEQARMAFNLKEDEREENFEEIINGELVYGGIIFGNKASNNSPVCKGLSFVQEDDHWKILLSTETKDGLREAVYENFSIEDLWAAYHIVRPTEQMKKKYGLWNQECSLMHVQGSVSVNVAAHPALLTTPIGLRLITLEAISGDLAFRKEKKERRYDVKSTLGLQWFDAPSRILIQDGEAKVVAADNPDLPLIRFRLLERLPTPKAYELQKDHVKMYLQNIWEKGTANQSSQEFTKNSYHLTVSDTAYLESKIIDQQFYNEVAEGTQAINFVDNFARLLALLNWAADHLGDTFPPLPKEAEILNTPVELNFAPDELQDLYRFPLKPVAPIETNDNQITDISNKWYKIIQNGRQIGFAQNVTGTITQNGKRKSLKMQKQSIYFLDNLESGISEQYYTRIFDDAGKLVSFNNLPFDSKASANEKEIAEKKALLGFTQLFPGKDWILNLIYKSHGDFNHLKKGESQTVGLVNSKPLKVTILESQPLVLKYSYETNEVLAEWGENGFPSRIFYDGLNTYFKPTTENETKNSFGFDVVTREYINYGVANDKTVGNLIPINPPFHTFAGEFQIECEWQKSLTSNDLKHLEKIGWNITKQEKPNVILLRNSRPLLEQGLFKIHQADPREPERWLLPEKLIDSDNNNIQKKAREMLLAPQYLRKNNQFIFFPQALHYQINLNDLDTANDQLLTESVQNKCLTLSIEVSQLIKHNMSNTRARRTSSEILNNPVGVCAEQARLLTAILRSQKIPAKYVAGIIFGPNEKYACSHAWVEVIINGYWYRIDPAQGAYQEQQVYIPDGENDNRVKFVKLISHNFKKNTNPTITINKNITNQEEVLKQLMLIHTIKSQDALCRIDDQDYYTKCVTNLSMIRKCLAENGIADIQELPEWRPGLIPTGLAILKVLEKSVGKERKSVNKRFGKEFAIINSLYPDAAYFLLPAQIKNIFDSISNDGGKVQFEEDLENADLPEEIKTKIGLIAIGDASTAKKMENIRALLVKHFDLENLIKLDAKQLELFLKDKNLFSN